MVSTIQHYLLTGTQVHEPKGVSAASDGTVYIADGLGSGSWSKILYDSEWAYSSAVSEVDFSSLSSFKEVTIWYKDLTAGSAKTLGLYVGDSSGYKSSTGYFKYSLMDSLGYNAASSSSTILHLGLSEVYHSGYTRLTNFNQEKITLIEGTDLGSSTADLAGVNPSFVSILGQTETNEDYDRIRLAFTDGSNFSAGRIIISGYYGDGLTVVPASKLLLSGDEQSGTDKILLEGDEQSGTDVLDLEGDEA